MCKYCKRGCVFTRHHCQVDLRKEEDIMIQDCSQQRDDERTRRRDDERTRRREDETTVKGDGTQKLIKGKNFHQVEWNLEDFFCFIHFFSCKLSKASSVNRLTSSRAVWSRSLLTPGRVASTIYRFSINGTMCTIVTSQDGQREVGQTNSALSLVCFMCFLVIQTEH